MLPLSVIITTYNEERNIEECLKTVLWANEVLVIDSFSTDQTREIAERQKATVLIHEYINPAAQKNWAIDKAKNDWVLIVDADERLSDSLQQEVQQLLKTKPAFDGYSIPFVNYIWGKRIRYCGWQRDYHVRLFDRHRGEFKRGEVHEKVILSTKKVGTLRHPIIHYPYRDLKQYFEKFQRYTDWGALELYKQGRQAQLNHLFFHPLFRFFRMYILQLGFLDGVHGLVLCMLSSFYVFTKYAKLWDLNQKKSL